MKWRYIGGLVGLACLLAAVLMIVHVALRPKTIVPNTISSQLTITLFVPQVHDIAAARATVKYDSSLQLLTFIVPMDGTMLTVSEQPTPDSFVDVPAVYTKTIESMEGYETFDSAQGTVDLTRPTNNDNKQVAVMNTKGTLLFIKANRDLTTDQWKQFFHTLTIQN
jgi:hypothetical protein